jgi:hypothetical protein
MPVATEKKDHVYKILELVGSSEKSIDDAWVCWPLSGDLAGGIYIRGVNLSKTPNAGLKRFGSSYSNRVSRKAENFSGAFPATQ